MAASYEVFGRKKQEQALTRIGSVTVDADATVEERVVQEHGEDWLELVAIPSGSIQWAIGKEKPA